MLRREDDEFPIGYRLPPKFMFVLCKHRRNADVGCSRLPCRLILYGQDSLVARGLSYDHGITTCPPAGVTG